MYGGGILGGTLNNSLVISNQASQEGGGVWLSILNNCTVVNNYVMAGGQGAGIYGGYARNSIILNNYDYPSLLPDNVGFSTGGLLQFLHLSEPSSLASQSREC